MRFREVLNEGIPAELTTYVAGDVLWVTKDKDYVIRYPDVKGMNLVKKIFGVDVLKAKSGAPINKIKTLSQAEFKRLEKISQKR